MECVALRLDGQDGSGAFGYVSVVTSAYVVVVSAMCPACSAAAVPLHV
jgi:hypothetical protein